MQSENYQDIGDLLLGEENLLQAKDDDAGDPIIVDEDDDHDAIQVDDEDDDNIIQIQDDDDDNGDGKNDIIQLDDGSPDIVMVDDSRSKDYINNSSNDNNDGANNNNNNHGNNGTSNNDHGNDSYIEIDMEDDPGVEDMAGNVQDDDMVGDLIAEDEPPAGHEVAIEEMQETYIHEELLQEEQETANVENTEGQGRVIVEEPKTAEPEDVPQHKAEDRVVEVIEEDENDNANDAGLEAFELVDASKDKNVSGNEAIEEPLESLAGQDQDREVEPLEEPVSEKEDAGQKETSATSNDGQELASVEEKSAESTENVATSSADNVLDEITEQDIENPLREEEEKEKEKEEKQLAVEELQAEESNTEDLPEDLVEEDLPEEIAEQIAADQERLPNNSALKLLPVLIHWGLDQTSLFCPYEREDDELRSKYSKYHTLLPEVPEMDLSMEEVFNLMRASMKSQANDEDDVEDNEEEPFYSMDEELILIFEGLNIVLGEDNYYAKDVTLGDLINLLVGLSNNSVSDLRPEGLVIHVSVQERFTSVFNALSAAMQEGHGLEQVENGEQSEELEDIVQGEDRGEEVGQLGDIHEQETGKDDVNGDVNGQNEVTETAIDKGRAIQAPQAQAALDDPSVDLSPNTVLAEPKDKPLERSSSSASLKRPAEDEDRESKRTKC